MPQLAPKLIPQVPAAPAPGLPLKTSTEAVQASLPFADPAATSKPKEAFVWDESKGIE